MNINYDVRAENHPFKRTGAEILNRPSTARFRKEMTESGVRLLGPA